MEWKVKILFATILFASHCLQLAHSWAHGIQNLDEVLRALPTQNQQAAVLTNHQMMDIKDISMFPILIRTAEYFRRFDGNFRDRNASELDKYNDEYPEVSCDAGGMINKDVLSKLWDAEIQVELFPEESQIHSWVRYCFNNAKQTHRLRLNGNLQPLFPTPSFNILVTEKTKKMSNGILQSWMEGINQRFDNSRYDDRQVYQDIFLSIPVSGNNEPISHVDILKPCEGTRCKMHTMSVAEFSQNPRHLWNTLSVEYTSSPWIGFWIHSLLKGDKMMDGISKNLLQCQQTGRVVEVFHPYEEEESRLYSVISRMILEFMPNQTYYLSPEMICENGKARKMSKREAALQLLSITPTGPEIIVQKLPNPSALYQQQISIKDKASRLRFIACGMRGIQSIPFQELYNIYDISVWIGIAASILVLSVGAICTPSEIYSTRSRVKFRRRWYENVLPFLRVLLEQRDPFPPSVSKISLIRWLLTGFFLSAIVLSKAYKGTNVYNMIKSRPPLLYDNIYQLMMDNFDIFTRISTFAMFMLQLRHGNWTMMATPHSVSLEQEPSFFGHITAYTEVGELSQGQRGSVGGWGNHQLELIHRWSRMHPRVVDIIFGIKDILTHAARGFDGDAIGIGGEFESMMRRRFFAQEGEIYFHELLRCNKSAIILPESQCKLYARRLIWYGVSHVSIGNEVHGAMSIAISAAGYAPFNILQRIHRLKVSGIVEWLTGIAETQNNVQQEERRLPQSASMSGNVVVIFVVLLAGCIGSATSFIIENGKRVSKCNKL